MGKLQRTMPKLPQQKDFFTGKATAHASTSAIRRYCMQKSNAEEGEGHSVDGAPLKKQVSQKV